ncbi:MAG: hypothetical protein ACOCPQ_04375 [Desulfosudaceae bacterium]
MSSEEKEKMELSHEPVKGYPAALYTAVCLAAGYLAFIFIMELGG